MLQQHAKAVLQQIDDPLFREKGIKLYIKREDLFHGKVSGNKWRKLKYNLEIARLQGHDTLLTFGGAYSNHIYALAAAAKEEGFKSIGIIRGEATEPLNATLSFAESCGMKLHYVSRNVYRNKDSSDFLDELEKQFGRSYILPEGGTNNLAVRGCTEIIDEIEIPFDYICTPVGTGGTVSGLIASVHTARVVGFSALKGDFLEDEVSNFLKEYGEEEKTNWVINTSYHFGGYAKIDDDLISFIRWFKKEYGVLLDPIYTGKMMYGVYQELKNGAFDKGSTIIALHTGGLQGWGGIKQRFGVEV